MYKFDWKHIKTMIDCKTETSSPIPKKNWQLLMNNCKEILPEAEFIQRIATGRPLTIKAGFDPTAKNLHLGHLALFRKLKHFQKLGHRCHFLIGDFTGRIGDPSGRSSIRSFLQKEVVTEFASKYSQQISNILDLKKITVVHNSKWYQDLPSEQLLEICRNSTVAQMLAREDFAERFRNKNSISIIEFIYPLLQAYDSVRMQADIELGGVDQKFNLLLGRELQIAYQQPPQSIITLPLLLGLDGQRKMSKSFQNTIDLTDDMFTIFSKIMSIADSMMPNYFQTLTDYFPDQIKELLSESFTAKKILATDIIHQLSDAKIATQTRELWENQKNKQKKNIMLLPPNAPRFYYTNQQKLIDAIEAANILEKNSRSEIRRLFHSQAIKMGKKLQAITSPDTILQSPKKYLLKIGKKKFLLLLPNRN